MPGETRPPRSGPATEAPRADRRTFLATKAELDRRLDTIPLPRALPAAPPPDRHEPR
jgi:hypothetical protein